MGVISIFPFILCELSFVPLNEKGFAFSKSDAHPLLMILINGISCFSSSLFEYNTSCSYNQNVCKNIVESVVGGLSSAKYV